MKLKGGSFNTIKQIAVGSAPTLVIGALSETKLAIGISGFTSADGLYILDTETGDMKTLTTNRIGAINILDRLY